MKIPQGMPSNVCPITSTVSDLAYRLLLDGTSDCNFVETYKEGNEDRRIHEEQCQNGSPAITKAGGNWSSKEDTNKSAALARLEQSTLPLCGNREVGWLWAGSNAICLREHGQSNEVAVKKHVERFHNLDNVNKHSYQLLVVEFELGTTAW